MTQRVPEIGESYYKKLASQVFANIVRFLSTFRYGDICDQLDFYLFVYYYLSTRQKFIPVISLHLYHYHNIGNLQDCRRLKKLKKNGIN